MDWYSRAACRGCDTDLWFAERGRGYGEALAVCGGCVVRGECLEAADREEGSDRNVFGVRGGLTPSERKRRRRFWREEEGCFFDFFMVGLMPGFHDPPMTR